MWVKQKPKACCYFENTHRRIEPPQVNDFVEVGKDVENESTRHAKCRRDHAEGSQCSRDIAGLKPQVAADCGCQCTKQQANVIVVETHAEIEPRQGLQSFRFKCSQVMSATEESQSVKEIERHNKPYQYPYEPPECRKQGKAQMDRFENYVKRCEKHDNAGAVNEIAGDADTKESFVRQDIPCNFRSSACDNQTIMDTKIDKDHRRKRE